MIHNSKMSHPPDLQFSLDQYTPQLKLETHQSDMSTFISTPHIPGELGYNGLRFISVFFFLMAILFY